MNATLSILGLLNADPDLLANNVLYLPEDVARDVVVDLLLAETAELEVLYTDPDVFKSVMRAWSKARLESWDRWTLAIREEYNPLHNFDRHEEYSDVGSDSSAGENSSTTETDGTQTQKNVGYDSTTSRLSGETDVDNTDTTTQSYHGSTSKHNTHTGHLYGNIGVTTSATMLSEELEVRKADLYNMIVRDIRDRFCLLVY